VTTAVARAALGMSRSLERLAGIEGVYARGNCASEPIRGVPVTHEYEVIDEETALPTKVISYDWRFVATELVVGNEPVTPRVGDRWTVSIAGVENVYEVLPIGKRPCFERVDSSGVILLVHTKRTNG
jgi:hypothetical protein